MPASTGLHGRWNQFDNTCLFISNSWRIRDNIIITVVVVVVVVVVVIIIINFINFIVIIFSITLKVL